MKESALKIGGVELPGNENQNEDLVKALSHPMRRGFVRIMLARREALTPREASVILDQPLTKLSYHVRVLAKYDAVNLVDTKPVRGSTQHFYRPAPALESSWVRALLERGSPGGGPDGDGSTRRSTTD